MKRGPIEPRQGDRLGRYELMIPGRWAIATMLAVLTAVSMTAHEVTYEGTVAAVTPNRYSAADGILARLEVNVRGARRPMVFDITRYTRLWRGNSPVTFEAARIEKDERVTVVFSDEEAEKGALEVRLTAQK
jgi:hypothetical protein